MATNAILNNRIVNAVAVLTLVSLWFCGLVPYKCSFTDDVTGGVEIIMKSQNNFRMLRSIEIAVDESTLDPTQFAYLILNYHKTGHQLSEELIHLVLRGIVSEAPHGNRVILFDHETNCPSNLAYLKSGTITVLSGPDIMCDAKALAHLLLQNPDKAKPRVGVKIIHMVRNPFTMAVSNYHYHSQDKAPEAPHESETIENLCDRVFEPVGPEEFLDLVLPTLQEGLERNPVMIRDDFNNISSDCHSLYQTRPDLEYKSAYDQIRMLDSKDGIRLATAVRIYEIARMANNIIKLRQLHALISEMNIANHIALSNQHEQIQVLTLSMDDFIAQPEESTWRFIEFVAGNALSHEEKELHVRKYENHYHKIIADTSKHITTGGSTDTEELIEYLRNHIAFGPPLSKIESLVNSVVLRDTRLL